MNKSYKFATAATLLTILLSPQINLQADETADEEMEEVLVSASLLPIVISRSANAITVISSDQFKNRAALSVSDLLRDVPGLAISRSGAQGALTQIRVRGTEANHLLVLIDGVEANDPSQGDELNWGTLTTADLERVEVIRGPQSAMRGSDAMAGVINIVTQSADQPFSAEAFAEIGSWSTRHSGISGGLKQGDLDIRLGVSHLDSEGANIARTGDEKDGNRNTTVTIRSGLKMSDQLRLSIAARQSDGMNQYDADNDFDGLIEDQDRESTFRNTTMRLQGDYISADSHWQHKLVIARSGNDNEAFADGMAGNITASTKYQYQYVGSLLWGASQRLSFLAEREQEDYQQRGPIVFNLDPNQDRRRNTNSLALEFRTDVSDRLSLAISGRYDDNSEFKSADSYKVEAVYRVSDGTRLRGVYGSAIKNPTFSERFGYYTNFVGNPDLQPEDSKSWEVGIDQQLPDSGLTLSVTLFHSELENEINGFIFDPVTFGFTSANKDGQSLRQGVELTAGGALRENLSLSAAYTYTDSEEPDSTGAAVGEIRRPRHTASLNLDWQASENWQINTNVQFNGSQTDTFFPPWPEPSRNVSLDNSTLVNINANYRVTETLDIYLRLENLLDDEYEEVFGYQTPGFGASLGIRLSL